MEKIYDGNVKARTDKALKELYGCNMPLEDKLDVTGFISEVKDIEEIYKRDGWEAVAYIMHSLCKHSRMHYRLGHEKLGEFYIELYCAANAWCQGYPVNAEEEVNANEYGKVAHLPIEHVLKIYSYLD